MAKRKFGVSGFGLIFTNEEADHLFEQIQEAACKAFDGREYSYDDHCYSIEASTTASNSNTENMLVFDADYQPSPYKTAYASEEDVVAEFKNKLGKYLPADFDYTSHIGTYSATYEWI